MIELLRYEDGKLSISPEITLHEPLQAIVDGDNSVKKEKSMMELLFVFLVKDPRSSLSGYPYNVRQQKANQIIGKDVKLTRKVQKAIDYYGDLLRDSNPSYRFWAAAQASMNRLTDILENSDWKSEESTFTVKEFADYIKNAALLQESLQELERKVLEQLYSAPKAKAGQTLTYFEDHEP